MMAHRRLYPIVALWQYHLIGRVDDCCNFKLRDHRGHPKFDFSIKTKLRWSTNVHEERESRPNSPLVHGYADVCYTSQCSFLGRISQPTLAGYIVIYGASPRAEDY